MTSKELTSLAIKVFAIYVLIQAILSLPMLANSLIFNALDGSRGNGEVLFWLLGSASLIALIVLVVFMWKLANRIVKQTSESPLQEDSPDISESFLVSLLGVYLTFEGLQGFGYATTNTFVLLQNSRELVTQNIAYLIGNLVQIVIGLSLILKTSGWVSFIRWLRGAGLKGKM
jgi:membrane-anchored glycerophosphoryl diester phosphodiesterase (GDPDase)